MSIYKDHDLIKLGKSLYRELLIINGSENFKKGFGKLSELFDIFLKETKLGRKGVKFRNGNNFVKSLVNIADKIPQDLFIDIDGKKVKVFDQYIEILKKVLANTDMSESILLDYVRGNKEDADEDSTLRGGDPKAVWAIQQVENLILKEKQVQLDSKMVSSRSASPASQSYSPASNSVSNPVSSSERDTSDTSDASSIHLDDDMEMLEADLEHQLEEMDAANKKKIGKLESAREEAEHEFEEKIFERQKQREAETRAYFNKRMQSIDLAYQKTEAQLTTAIEESKKDLMMRLHEQGIGKKGKKAKMGEKNEDPSTQEIENRAELDNGLINNPDDGPDNGLDNGNPGRGA